VAVEGQIEARAEGGTAGKLIRLLPVYAVVFVAFLGYGLMVALFVPMIMGNNGLLPMSSSSGDRTLVLGILLALYPLGQFVGSPMIGTLSDRFGRKPVLLTSLAVTTVGYIGIATSIDMRLLPLLMVTSFISGLSESNVALAQSIIADVTTVEERGRLIGWVWGCNSLGYIIGPVIGGTLVVHFGYSVPFWIAPLLFIGLITWVLFGLAETRPARDQAPIRYIDAFTNLRTVFTDRSIRQLYFVNAILFFAIYGFFRGVLMYIVDEWAVDVYHLTIYQSYMALMAAIANFFAMPILARRFDLKSVTIGTAVIGGLLCISVVIPASESSIWLTSGLTSFAVVLTLSACSGYLSTRVDADRQGSVMGNNQALQVGGEAVTAAACGALAAVLIPLPLVVYGLLAILAGLILASSADSH
jgi:MFS family permease